ncbi:MAG: ABC transporter permease [Acidobacteria bacterium]|nr:ABC transporter permease [Acidobacteriota bacterium]
MFSTFRIAVRTLARRPSLTLVAVFSLAAGIGLNTAVFSLVDALYLRPPDVRNPYSLVHVNGWFKDSGSAILDWPDYEEVTKQTDAFSSVTASMRRGGLWRTGDEVLPLLVTVVAENYFDMLGVRPVIGQLPGKGHNYASDSTPPIAVAHWFWQERMGARSDIIGLTMDLSGRLYRVAAVLSPQFRGVEPSGTRHIWIPAGSWKRYAPRDFERGSGQFELLARLRPASTVEQAQSQLDVLSNRIESADSKVAKGRRLLAASLAKQIRDRVRPGLIVLAIVALVLFVACANVAAALLVHAEERRREIGVRLAMGARRSALLGQFFSESAVLAVAGSVAGLLLGRWLMLLAPLLAPPTTIPVSFDLRLDVRLLGFTAAAALLTLLIFGFAPLAYSLRVSLLDALSGARVAGRSRHSRSSQIFVAAQVALSVVVVAGAVVASQSLREAGNIYPGYDSTRPLALVWAHKQAAGKSEPIIYSEAARRIQAVAGVESVTFARHFGLVGTGSGATLSAIPEGMSPGAPPPRVYFNLVGPRFFELTGARMLRGRAFTDADHAGNAPAMIINAEAAARFWPMQDAIGKSVRIRDNLYQVTGIAVDGRISSLYEAVAPALYLPASRMQWGETIFIAATKTDPAQVLKEIAKATGQDGDLRVYQSMTLRTLMKQALYLDWLPTVLGGLLAIVALLLAGGGLYGAMSHSTQRRLPEFGVRMAVGASPRHIASLVIREGAAICLAGVPIGVAAFVAIYTYTGATMMHGRPLDPKGLVAGVIVTVVTVLSAALAPALRAAHVDASEVLRSE